MLTSVAHRKSRHHHVRVANCLDLRKIVKRSVKFYWSNVTSTRAQVVRYGSGLIVFPREDVIAEQTHFSMDHFLSNSDQCQQSKQQVLTVTSQNDVALDGTNLVNVKVVDDVIETRVYFVQHSDHLQGVTFL